MSLYQISSKKRLRTKAPQDAFLQQKTVLCWCGTAVELPWILPSMLPWICRGFAVDAAVDLPWICRGFCHRDFIAKFPLRPELTAGPQDRRRWPKSFPYADIFAQVLPLCAHSRPNPSLTRILSLKSFPRLKNTIHLDLKLSIFRRQGRHFIVVKILP